MTKCEGLTQSECQQGFSLIEVLVALVILVVGLIGIFNLHIVAKRGSFESFQQTQASYYANDIINRMRLNVTQLPLYNGSHAGAISAISPVSPTCKGVTLCTPAELAAWDIYEWRAAFSGEQEIADSKQVGGLDTPTACISVNAVTRVVSVTFAWRGISATSDGIGSIACGTASNRRRVFTLSTVI
ncbi:MAG: type IV pilus modification protein PilV [Shewanella sp.]